MSELVQPIEAVGRPGPASVTNAPSTSASVLTSVLRNGSMPKPRTPSILSTLLPMAIVAIVLGVGTGYVLSAKLAKSASTSSSAKTSTKVVAGAVTPPKIEVGKVYGEKDATAFKDSAEGVLVAGGKDGEGSHHLLREGGESQNVYLSSSAVNLDDFINVKVLVRGQTNSAQKAGWLMDVGQVKVEELNAQLPAWAQQAADKAGMKDN